jgi:hypothetical protein
MFYRPQTSLLSTHEPVQYTNCSYSVRSQSQSYFTTDGLPSISSTWWQAFWDSRPKFSFQLNTCGNSPYVTSSLTRRWACLLWICLALKHLIFYSRHRNKIKCTVHCTVNVKAHLKHTITSTPAKYKIAALHKRKDMKRKNIKNETNVTEVNYIWSVRSA